MNSRRFFSAISPPFILDRQLRSHFLSIHTDTYISITYLFMSQVLISFILMYSFIVLFLQYKDSASTQNASLYTNFGSHTDPSTFFFWLNTLTLYLEYKGRRRKMVFTKGGTEQFGEKKIENGLREDLIMVFKKSTF